MNITELIQVLEDSPGMVFDIFENRTGQRIQPANISFESLENPVDFFTAMLDKFDEFYVQLKEKRGNGGRNPRAPMLVRKETKIPLQSDFRSVQPEFAHPNHMHFDSGYSGLNGLAGLNGSEVISSMIDAKSLRTENKLLQENLAASKRLISSLESQLKQATLRNTKLEVDNKTLETLKNLEKEKALIESESGFSKFLGRIDPGQVIPMLAMFAPKPSSQPTATSGLAGVDRLSDQKKRIIQLVSEDLFEQSHAELLLKIAEHLATQDGFFEQLKMILFSPSGQSQPSEPEELENLSVVS